MSELTTQQSLLLEQKRQVLELASQTNRALDGKAVSIIQTAGIILALVGLLAAAGFISESSPSLPDRIFLVMAIIAFIFMIALATHTVFPVTYRYPGVSPGEGDWEKMYASYVYASPDDCFAKILSDYQDALGSQRENNKAKTKGVKWMSGLLAGIALSLVLTVIA